jgi:hypothetical protein
MGGSKVNVIGLTGYAGSGKSTVANYLVEEHGFTRLSFAAPLKKMLRTLNPIIGNQPNFMNAQTFRVNDLFEVVERDGRMFDDTTPAETVIKESSWGPEYRRLLQVLGTDCIRAVDEDFWVNAAFAQMSEPDGKYVFDDVRFPNEGHVILPLNPFGLWNVTRPGYEAVNGHDSEKWAGSMGERIWLHNGLDIEGLHDQIDAALNVVAA